jgi:hypothetical protein
MLPQEMPFKIIPDPANPALWAYELNGKVVGGFKSSKLARQACDRARRRK